MGRIRQKLILCNHPISVISINPYSYHKMSNSAASSDNTTRVLGPDPSSSPTLLVRDHLTTQVQGNLERSNTAWDRFLTDLLIQLPKRLTELNQPAEVDSTAIDAIYNQSVKLVVEEVDALGSTPSVDRLSKFALLVIEGVRNHTTQCWAHCGSLNRTAVLDFVQFRQVMYKGRLWPHKFVDIAFRALKANSIRTMYFDMCENLEPTEKEDDAIFATIECKVDETLVWQDGMAMVEEQALHIAKRMECDYIRYRCQVDDCISVVYPPRPFIDFIATENLGAWYIFLWTHPDTHWHCPTSARLASCVELGQVSYEKEVCRFLDSLGLRIKTKHWHMPIMPSTTAVLAGIGKGESKILALYDYAAELAGQK